MSVSHNQLHAILVSIRSQMHSLKACNHSAIFSALEPNISIHVRMVSADDITMSCSNQCGIGPIILTLKPPLKPPLKSPPKPPPKPPTLSPPTSSLSSLHRNNHNNFKNDNKNNNLIRLQGAEMYYTAFWSIVFQHLRKITTWEVHHGRIENEHIF